MTPPVVAKNATQGAKLNNLTATFSLGGSDPNEYYHKPQAQGEVVDFHLHGLKDSCVQADLKKAARVKHIISMEIDEDKIKGICKGTARMKIRLNEGETKEMVR